MVVVQCKISDLGSDQGWGDHRLWAEVIAERKDEECERPRKTIGCYSFIPQTFL